MMRALSYILLPLLYAFAPAFASFCGKSGVPYSFEVLPNGAPVLGCAQPSRQRGVFGGDGTRPAAGYRW